MKYWRNILLFTCTIFLGISCVDPYEPPVLAQANNYLVIEGVLRNGEPTTIRLTRTARLADTAQIIVEPAAVVKVESESGSVFPFQEGEAGTYVSAPIDLNPEDRYRLHIRTSENKEYLSAYVDVKEAPPIDSLSWTIDESGVQLYVNTHDPQHNTRYYRWEYEETWEYQTPYQSLLMYVDGEIVDRIPPTPNICWQQSSSRSLLLGSSAKLSSDIIYMQQLASVPRMSWKLDTKYSILVKQYALSKEAFEYFQQMKKNSEQMGSFFDPQPMELASNYYAVNADEPVIGYFSAGRVQEKRIFIKNSEVQPWGTSLFCELIPVTLDSLDFYFAESLVPIYAVPPLGIVYGSADLNCFNCAVRAEPVQPDFWE